MTFHAEHTLGEMIARVDEAERRGVTVAFVQDLADILQVVATRTHLLNVLADLIRNSVEALPKGGSITISTRREGKHRRPLRSRQGRRYLPQSPSPFFTTKRTVGADLSLSTVDGILKW